MSGSNVIGVWRLVDGAVTDEEGGRHGRPYGPRGTGLLSLSATGHMMAVLVDARPAGPEGERREYASYCGTWSFDGETLTTSTYAWSDEARFAPPQRRRVRFEGERLILSPPPAERDGRLLTRTLVWERISDVAL